MIGDIMRRFRAKRKLKKRVLIKLLIIIILFFMFFKFLKKNLKNYLDISQKKLTSLGIESISNNDNNILNKIYTYTKENIINKPNTMLVANLEYKSNKNNLSKKNKEKIKKVVNNISDEPIIYIYSTHQKEEYIKDGSYDYNITPGVFLASQILEEKLNNNGINTMIMKDNITEYLNNNHLDYSKSYIASRHFLEPVINKYTKVKLFIDLHRDAAKKDVTTIDINGNACARIMFVIGKEYSTYEANLSIANKLNNMINNKYPNLSRGVLQKQGYGVNGIYNQDLKDNVILIELGGNENNLEEVSNTIEMLVNIIGDYVNEKES